MSDMNAVDEICILRGLLFDEEYARKVVPYLKTEYFKNPHEKLVIERVIAYFVKYNKPPPPVAIFSDLDKSKVSETIFDESVKMVQEAVKIKKQVPDADWQLEMTEKFCKDRAIQNAIIRSIDIIDGKEKLTTNALPDILTEALAVSFDTNIGHDYNEGAEYRFDYYHRVENRIPFTYKRFNDITGGGVTRKTLNVVMAGTNVGKSMFLCDHAACLRRQNYNVLYITCEMSEEETAKRIDANVLDLPMELMDTIPKVDYLKRLDKFNKTHPGKLVVKEYPTTVGSAIHFKHLLAELKLKKQFIPDVMIVDYLNLCASSRVGSNAKGGSYEIIKAVSEELRAIAVEHNVCVFTATQTNREGSGSSDVNLENVAESFGLPMTADFMFALISTPELEAQGKLLVKQLKNRTHSKTGVPSFYIGVDRTKSKFYDVRGGDAPQTNNVLPDTHGPTKQSPDKGKSCDDWDFS